MKVDARIMRGAASDLIRAIKNYAENQVNSVYSLAQIPPPSGPTPLPATGRPNIEVTLRPNGSVTLSWDAINAAASSGAFYNIYRKLPGQTAFVGSGGTPGATTQSRRMSFTDATIPGSAADSDVQYIMQG